MDLEGPEDYLSKVWVQINLDQIYRIKSRLHYNMDSKIIAVLLEMKDSFVEFIDYHTNCPRHDPEARLSRYLLQIWSCEGILVYEHRLERVPEAWNI